MYKKNLRVHNKRGGEFIMKRKANEQKNVQGNALFNSQAQRSRNQNSSNSQEFGAEQDFQQQPNSQKTQNPAARERAKRGRSENKN